VATAVHGARFAAVAALAVGLALVALALPRTVAEVLANAGDDVPAALGRGERPSPERLSAAAARHRAALGWLDSPAIRTDLAAIELARAASPSLPPEARRAFLDAAIGDYRAGLARGPARPYSWAQLAEAAFACDGMHARLDPLVDMSLTAGRLEPPLVLRRVALGFRAGRILDAQTRQAIRGQVRVAAASSPWPLAEFARDRFALGWVRDILADDPRLLRRFDATYFSLPVR
jgi:hypothetical protein